MNYLKSYLFLFLFLIVSQAQGQYMNEGDLLVGGNGNIRLQFGESDNNTFSIGLSPTLATFVTSNLAVGGSLGLGYSNFSNGSSISFGLTPLLRYYYPTGENAAVFGDARVGLRVISFENDFFDETQTDTALSFSLGGGLAFFVSDDVTIDLFLNYFDATDDFTNPTISLNVGFQIFIIRSADVD